MGIEERDSAGNGGEIDYAALREKQAAECDSIDKYQMASFQGLVQNLINGNNTHEPCRFNVNGDQTPVAEQLVEALPQNSTPDLRGSYQRANPGANSAIADLALESESPGVTAPTGGKFT